MFSQIFPDFDISGTCGLDEGHKFLSFNAAPDLLLYSYIPAVFIALVLSLLVFRQNKKDFIAKSFLLVSVSFSMWVFNIILQWIAVPNNLIFFGWQITAFLEALFYLSSLYFFLVFITHKKVNTSVKSLLISFLILVLILSPSIFNVSSYDYENCEGELGMLWTFLYAFEIFISILILVYGLIFAHKKSNILRKKEITLFSIALSVFLGIFTASNLSGELIQVYSVNLYGPIGMVIFIGFVTYLILKYKSFNIKIFSSEVLVVSLWLLVAALMLIDDLVIIHIVTLVTLIVVIIFGIFLIKSVKKEIEQKEKLIQLNMELESLITQRESLTHLITHKVKGAFTRSKYIFAGLLDGSFGDISPEVRKMAETGLKSDNSGISTVDLILNVSNMQKGLVKLESKPINFKDLFIQVFEEKKNVAEMKGLKLDSNIEEGEYKILGDLTWIKEVINNLVDNAISYTKEGGATMSLARVADNKLLFKVKDTGVGISEEDKKVLFTEGGRGKESTKVNVDSTGYGLFTVKLVVEGHGGRVWAESEGVGKGSTFCVELPIS